MSDPKKPTYSCWPDATHTFWLYSEDLLFFETEKERDAFARESIEGYLDDGWNEEVENVCAGVVTHTTMQINREDKPEEPTDPEELEEFYSDWPDECDYKCNYELRPIEEKD